MDWGAPEVRRSPSPISWIGGRQEKKGVDIDVFVGESRTGESYDYIFFLQREVMGLLKKRIWRN